MTQLYSISYMYYSIIGCFTTILLGWTISYFTGSESDLYDEELIHPWARKMAHVFPGKKRLYFRKDIEVEEKREKIPSNKSLSKLDQAVTVHASPSCSKESKPPKENSKSGMVNPTFSSELPDDNTDGIIFKTKL